MSLTINMNLCIRTLVSNSETYKVQTWTADLIEIWIHE